MRGSVAVTRLPITVATPGPGPGESRDRESGCQPERQLARAVAAVNISNYCRTDGKHAPARPGCQLAAPRKRYRARGRRTFLGPLALSPVPVADQQAPPGRHPSLGVGSTESESGPGHPESSLSLG